MANVHLLKYSKWQGSSGNWYCNDVSSLGSGVSGKWWVPARMLGMSLEDYILFLRDEYGAIIDSYNKDTDILIYHWTNESKCNKFILYINKVARAKQFYV